jgi:glycosyltransferase involved in cell wall biosynthesis
MIAAQKLGLIFLDFEPRWRSLRPIHANSHFAYTRAFPGLSVFKVNVNQEQELHTTILLMKKRELTRLVLFANRFPDCKKLIDVIDRRLPHLNEFIFHIDGAFTYYLNDWIRILQRLRGRKVCLVAASTAQAELVDRILEPYLDVQITVCPFGVSGKLSSAKLRTRTRAALGLKTEEIALTAVGRISKFKNLDVLVDFFQQYLSTSPKRLRLFIAGSFDDNAGNFGQSGPHGKYFYAWQRWFKGLPQHVQDQISFCGELERGEVEALYAGSDVFVSLSTFHDEDFGRLGGLSRFRIKPRSDTTRAGTFRSQRPGIKLHIVRSGP